MALVERLHADRVNGRRCPIKTKAKLELFDEIFLSSVMIPLESRNSASPSR